MRNITKEDFCDIPMIKNLALSPDGQWLGFCSFAPDLATDSYRSTIRLLNTQSREERQLTFDGREHLFFFADDSTIAYAEYSSSGTDIVGVDIASGEKNRLFSLPLYAVDMREYAGGYVVQHSASCRAPDPQNVCWKPEEFIVCEEFPAFMDGLGHIDGMRSALSLWDAQTHKLNRVTADTFSVYGWSIKGQLLCYFGVEYGTLRPQRFVICQRRPAG